MCAGSGGYEKILEACVERNIESLQLVFGFSLSSTVRSVTHDWTRMVYGVWCMHGFVLCLCLETWKIVRLLFLWVCQAVTFLDGMGVYVGRVLRRHPWIRLIFGVYVILLHLWILFVMNHFVHELGTPASAGPPSPTQDGNVGG